MNPILIKRLIKIGLGGILVKGGGFKEILAILPKVCFFRSLNRTWQKWFLKQKKGCYY
jgi:hypothetical protein